MCSQTDAPDQHDGPVYSTPRVYDLAGERPRFGSLEEGYCGTWCDLLPGHTGKHNPDWGALIRERFEEEERGTRPEPRGSVALAVCGDFIERYEAHGQWIRATTVRRLRDAIAEAEAAVRA